MTSQNQKPHNLLLKTIKFIFYVPSKQLNFRKKGVGSNG